MIPQQEPINAEKSLKSFDKEHILDQNSPEMQRKVEAFIQAAQGGPGGAPAAEAKPVIAPSTDFDKDPMNIQGSEAMVEQKEVVVDVHEKAVFLKALLNDTPVRLTIHLFGGQMWVDLRSRTAFEQERLWAILRLQQNAGLIEKSDLALAVQRFQQYGMALMVEKINGVQFSDLHFDGSRPLDEDAAAILHFCKEHIFHLNQVRWTALINAMRIFEGKLARMSTEANNGDFWQPRG